PSPGNSSPARKRYARPANQEPSPRIRRRRQRGLSTGQRARNPPARAGRPSQAPGSESGSSWCRIPRAGASLEIVSELAVGAIIVLIVLGRGLGHFLVFFLRGVEIAVAL